MTLVDVLWLVGLVAAVVGMGFVELGIDAKATPHGRLRSYLLWAAVGASGASFILIQMGHGWDAALVYGLAFGLACQPLAVVARKINDLYYELGVYNAQQDDDWMRTASWRRGRKPLPPRPDPEKPVSDDAWMETAFWRQGRPPRPAYPFAPKQPASAGLLRAQLGLAAAVAVLWPALTVGADLARDPRRMAFVTADVEAMGFEQPRVWRTLTSPPCWGGAEYDWRSEAGDGRACVRDGDYVTLVVERDRTSTDPFARPAL